MYEYQPQRQNRRAAGLVLLLFCAAVVAFVGANLAGAYPVILQTLGLCLFVPIIQISNRYLFSRYLYRLRQREGAGVDLEIFLYKGGTRMQLVCRIGLEEVRYATELGEGNRKPPHAVRRHNYCMDIGPVGALVVGIENGDGCCELLLVPDETIKQALVEAAARSDGGADITGTNAADGE